MNDVLVGKLKKGLYLESSKQLLAWQTPFDNLKNLGKPEFKKQSDQRSDLIWTREKILNGLTVDLIIMRWFGILGMNKKFKNAHAYLSKVDFELTKKRLDKEFGKEGKHKKLNDLEYEFTWSLGECKIILKQGERFGSPIWTIQIKHQSSWLCWLK